MYNDRQIELEQNIPETIVQHLTSTHNNQHTSGLVTGWQCGASESNFQDEIDYIDRWYDGLIGMCDD